MSDAPVEQNSYRPPAPEELAEREWQQKGPEGILEGVIFRGQQLQKNAENVLLMIQKAKEEGIRIDPDLLKQFLLPFAGEADDQLIQINGKVVNAAGNLFTQGVKMKEPELETRRSQRRTRATQPKTTSSVGSVPKPSIELFKK